MMYWSIIKYDHTTLCGLQPSKGCRCGIECVQSHKIHLRQTIHAQFCSQAILEQTLLRLQKMFASNKELVTFCWFPSKAITVLSHGVPPICTSFIKKHQHFWLVAGHIRCKVARKYSSLCFAIRTILWWLNPFLCRNWQIVDRPIFTAWWARQ